MSNDSAGEKTFFRQPSVYWWHAFMQRLTEQRCGRYGSKTTQYFYAIDKSVSYLTTECE